MRSIDQPDAPRLRRTRRVPYALPAVCVAAASGAGCAAPPVPTVSAPQSILPEAASPAPARRVASSVTRIPIARGPVTEPFLFNDDRRFESRSLDVR